MSSNGYKKNILEICKVISQINTTKEAHDFMVEILTKSELETLSKRWCILKELSNNITQREISKEHNISLCNITRGAKILKNKNSIVAKFLTKE